MSRRYLPMVLGSVQSVCEVCGGPGRVRTHPPGAPEFTHVIPCPHCRGVLGGQPLARRRLAAVLGHSLLNDHVIVMEATQ